MSGINESESLMSNGESYGRYVCKSGLVGVVYELIQSLRESQPEDPIRYFIDNFQSTTPTSRQDELEELRQQLTQKLNLLSVESEELRMKLDSYEGGVVGSGTYEVLNPDDFTQPAPTTTDSRTLPGNRSSGAGVAIGAKGVADLDIVGLSEHFHGLVEHSFGQDVKSYDDIRTNLPPKIVLLNQGL